jgi:hypothetical protein
LPRLDAGGIVDVMPTRQSADPTPDLFAATPKPEAHSKADPKAVAQARPRYLLPTDLAGALKGLDDTEVDTLLAAVTGEAERRGRLPRASVSKTPPAEDGGGALTKGKLNAVRAAFKAGVKPSAISRQFGISQSDVRKALATEGRDRKSRG